MEFTAHQIASMLEGTIEGNQDIKVAALCKIEEGHAGGLTFLANPKYVEYIYSTDASIAIVAKDFQPDRALPSSLTLIRVADAYGSFAKLLEAYNQLKQPKPGIHPSAVIAETATIGEAVYIGPLVYIADGATIGRGCKIHSNTFIGEGTVLGDGCTVYAGVRIYADCKIGQHVTLHSGVVIGGDGFGFAPNSENNYSKVPQIGNVILEDHVEVGSNTTIDRATLGSTIVRRGAKLDNLIQIAHNVEIGQNTVIAAQTGVAGSTRIGANCMIGGQVGIVGHISIADGTKIAAQSGIGKDIKEPNTIVQGSPAFGFMDYKKSYVGFMKLPDLLQQISELRQEINKLKSGAVE
jgi:UDP-3-O-[3-hydroxymyristoyl] glucosamine N-acyltransferase